MRVLAWCWDWCGFDLMKRVHLLMPNNSIRQTAMGYVPRTITLCEVSGTTNGDPEAARAAFRAPAVQQALAAIGYFGGEEVVAGHDGQTDFVFYVNREA